MIPMKKPAQLFQNPSLHSSKIQAHTQTVMKSKMKENVVHTIYTIATLYSIAILGGGGNPNFGRSEY